METYRILLQNELASRLERNPFYSLRSFAKLLDVSPGALSEILSGKRGLSLKKGRKILDKIMLRPEIEKEFISSIQSTKAKNKLVNLDNKSRPHFESNYAQLSGDTLKVISDWYHFAILSLAKIQDAPADAQWIAKRLSIPQITAKLALDRLIRLKLIKIVDGRMKRAAKQVKTTDGTPSKYIQKLQRELLEKAIESLEKHPVNKRNVSSIVICTNKEKLIKAQKKIVKFRREMTELLENDLQNSDQIYALTISMFPLSEESE